MPVLGLAARSPPLRRLTLAFHTPHDEQYLSQTPVPGALPDDLPRYFDLRGARIVPLASLVNRKTEVENRVSGDNAAKFMAETARGKRPKRAPLSVSPLPGGRFLIEGGNATYTAAKQFGWSALPVRLTTSCVTWWDMTWTPSSPATVPRFARRWRPS